MDQAARRAVPRFLRAMVRLAVPAALLASIGTAGIAAPAVGDPGVTAHGAGSSAADAVVASTTTDASVPGESRSSRSESAQDGVVSVFLSPASGGSLAPGTDLVADVLVANRTDAELPAGDVSIAVGERTIDTRTALDGWTRAAQGSDDPSAVDTVRADVGTVAPGEDRLVRVTVPAAALPFDGSTEFGPRTLEATYTQAGAVAGARSTFVFTNATDGAPTRLSVIVPIIPPESTEAALDAEALTELTAPDGRLTRLLDAVDGTAATLAIDPRILLSIRALGEAAPPSATAWLQRLTTLPNDSFPLPYADADTTLAIQAGATGPPMVEQVEFALDPSVTETATPTPTPTPTTPGTEVGESPTPTGTPTPTEPAADLPTYAELTAFPYTLEGVSWPSANTVSGADLQTLTGWGSTDVVLDGGNVQLGDEISITPPASTVVGDVGALVADPLLSSAVATAAASDDDADWNAATALASTVLAVVARERPSESRTILATLGRHSLEEPARLGELLRHVDALAWTDLTTATFPAVPAAGEDPDGDTVVGTLIDRAHDQAVVDRAIALRTSEAKAIGYSTIFDDASRFTGELHGRMLAATSSGWFEDPDEWVRVTDDLMNLVTVTESSVYVTDASSFQLVGRETELPVFVSNNTDERVTVEVQLRPSTGKLDAGDPVVLTIEPRQMARALLPVTAITNGATTAEVALYTPDGVALPSRVTVDINVQAEWEAVGIAVFSVGVVLLFVAGVIRTIRKRRRERVGASTAPDEVVPSEE